MINDEVLKKGLALMASSPANHDYFFMKLSTPDWIEPLLKAGRFKSPPPAVREGTTIRFPPWPESQYLVRLSSDAPEIVKDVISKVPQTDNQRVHQDFVEAALKMPSSIAAEVGAKESEWIREQRYLYVLYPDRVSDLIAYLAEENQTIVALKLTNALLQLSPDPRESTRLGDNQDSIEMPTDAVAKFDDWHYQQSLNRVTKPLVIGDRQRAFDTLSGILEFAIKVRSRRPENAEDFSWIWRPRIQINGNHGDVKDSLVSAVRDAAVLIAESDPQTVPGLIHGLLARRWRIFRRIAAHAVSTIPNIESQAISLVLARPLHISDYPETEPELADFLEKSFSTLSDELRQHFLANIDTGPMLDDFTTRVPEAEVGKFVRHWKLLWLDTIRDVLPDGKWLDLYQELVKEFGQPAAATYDTGGAFIGPTSPKSLQELRELEPKNLINYLQTWAPSNEWASPTPPGLGRQLAALVSERPETFALIAHEFIGLNKIYVNSAIDGFSSAVKNGSVIDWVPLLRLCDWAIDQDGNSKGDPDVMASRMAVVRLIREGLETSQKSQPPQFLRQTIWGFLNKLVTGPDIDFGKEQRYAKQGLAGSLSLNAPRGIALDAVIDYALWIYRYDPKRSEAGESGFSEVPEVRSLLDKILVTRRSWDIDEVLGRRFAALFMLDRSWAKANVDLIFNLKEKPSDQVSWINYLFFCQPYRDLLILLKPQYERAINSFPAVFDSSTEREYQRRFIAHLAGFFFQGLDEPDDQQGLLKRFFEKTPVESRAYLIEYIGRSLRNSAGNEGEDHSITARSQKLLEDRINAIKQSGKGGIELAPFGWWFIAKQFELEWSIRTLLAVLRLSHKISPDWLVVECLAKDVEFKTLQAVEALEQIVIGDTEGWAIYGWEQQAKELLKKALNSNELAAKEAAVRVVNIIGARGQYGFRDLLRSDK